MVIFNRTGAVLWQGPPQETIATAVTTAVAAEANLRGANLRGANLRGANLRGADLSGAECLTATEWLEMRKAAPEVQS